MLEWKKREHGLTWAWFIREPVGDGGKLRRSKVAGSRSSHRATCTPGPNTKDMRR